MSSFTLKAGTCAFIMSSSAAALEVQPRIIGGCETSTSEYSYTVALALTTGLSEFQSQFCGGTLIHENWVLTAAHCLYTPDGAGGFDPMVPGDVQILFDAHSLSLTDIAAGVAVTDIVVHASYDVDNAASPFDIALLKLDTPQTGRDIVRLPTSKPGEALEALTLGWGDTDISASTVAYSTTLREVNIDTYSNAACALANPTITLTDNQLCAGTQAGGKDSCQGDSGGPLLLDTPNGVTQVGIVSFGFGCAVAATPGVYTSVDAYPAWIETNTFNIATGNSDIPAPAGVGEAYSSLPSSCPDDGSGSGTGTGEETGGESSGSSSSPAISLGSGSGASGHGSAAAGSFSGELLWLGLVPLMRRLRRTRTAD